MLGACSDQFAPTAEVDAGDVLPAEDGSPAGCAAVGGTCVSYQTGCPLPQQNSALCEDSVLICCLQPGGEQLPDAGESLPEAAVEAGSVDAAMEAAPVEAAAEASTTDAAKD
jgi:hypothetical protein